MHFGPCSLAKAAMSTGADGRPCGLPDAPASPATIKTFLGMRRPPSQRLRRRLETWVAAPEVAAELAATFRPNGAGRDADTGNGAAKDGLSEALESDRANLFGGDASLQRDIAKGAHRVFE
jgi:hypothetical protein